MSTLDLEAAVALLEIHPVTLQEKARAGEIPGAKIGRLGCSSKLTSSNTSAHNIRGVCRRVNARSCSYVTLQTQRLTALVRQKITLGGSTAQRSNDDKPKPKRRSPPALKIKLCRTRHAPRAVTGSQIKGNQGSQPLRVTATF